MMNNSHLLTTSVNVTRAVPAAEITFSFIDVIVILILTGIMIIGIIGNMLVIYVFGLKPGKHIKRFEGFLLLLGIVDLLSSFIIPLSFLYLTATGFQKWHFGEGGCKIIPSLLQISVTLSQGVLILISYERYHTLVKPFNDKLSNIKVGLWLCFVGVLSIIFVIPHMKSYQIYEDRAYGISTCVPNERKHDISMAAATIQLLRDIVALSIMTFFGYRMNHALTKQHDNLTWEREKMSRKGRQLLRKVIYVFSLLTLPMDIFHVALYTTFLAKTHISPSAYKVIIVINTFLNLLQTSNSAVNVFIYSRMHSMFQLQCCIQARPAKQTCSSDDCYNNTRAIEIELLQNGNNNNENGSDK